jgi:hypothetical protein
VVPRIEVNEIENQPFFREKTSKGKTETTSVTAAPGMNRQPLRPKLLSQQAHLKDVINVAKPTKTFAVFSDKPKPTKTANLPNTASTRAAITAMKSPKRIASSENMHALSRPTKSSKPQALSDALSKESIEAMVERKVAEALAGRADQTTISSGDAISEEVQRRLDALEKRVQSKETERAEGLQYLLMAKQHQVRGEETSALKMYQLALPHFPGNEKLLRKVAALQDRIGQKKAVKHVRHATQCWDNTQNAARSAPSGDADDMSYHDADDDDFPAGDCDDDDTFAPRARSRSRRPKVQQRSLSSPEPGTKHSPPEEDSDDELATALTAQTPRTKQLLTIINTKDVSKIKLLKGVGAKKAEAIVNCLCDLEDSVTNLGQLGKLKGVGVKTVENMRCGLNAAAA